MVFVSWLGAQPIVVVGALGEPFARIGPSGVEVNLHSPTWIDNARSRDQDVSGLVADPTASPAWTVAATQPSLAWLELRGQVPEGRQRVVWRIPIESDEGASAIVAETRRVTPRSVRSSSS